MMINFFIFIFSFSIIISQDDENGKSYYEFITNNPSLYKNEICSYNGYPNVKATSIECDCYSSFVNEPRKEKVKFEKLKELNLQENEIKSEDKTKILEKLKSKLYI